MIEPANADRFVTPRKIIDAIIAAMDIKLTDTIIDPVLETVHSWLQHLKRKRKL